MTGPDLQTEAPTSHITEPTSALVGSRLATVRQFSARHPAFPEGGLRYLIFHAESNGFSKCIRRIGRKVLLDEAAVFQWIDEQNHQDGLGGRS